MTSTRWYELLLSTSTAPYNPTTRRSTRLFFSSFSSVSAQKLTRGLRQTHGGKHGVLNEMHVLTR